MSKIGINYISKAKHFFRGKLSNRGLFFYHVFFVLFAFLFIGRSIDFHFLTHYINGMDTYQWLNFGESMKKSLFIWNPGGSGKVDPMVFTPFVYNLILKMIQALTNHLILSVNIYCVLFIYLLQISFFYFYRIFFSGKKSLLITLFTFLNIKMITTLYAPIISVNIALIAFPLMFFLLHSYIFKKKFVYFFLIVIFQIVLFRVLNVLILTNILVPLLLFLLFRNQMFDKKGFIKKVILMWVLSFLVCSVLIINMGISFNNVSTNTNVKAYNNLSTSSFYRDRDSLLNLFRLTNHFSLADNEPEFPGFLFFKFSKLYMSSWFFIVVSFLFFGLFLANFLQNMRNKRILIILSCLVILIFLGKTLNPPGEFINQWLYSNNFYLMLFRSGSKYFMYLVMPLAILVIFLGDKKFKFFYPLVLLYMFSHAFLIFFYAKPVAEYWNTTLPFEYSETTLKLNSLGDENKILILPNGSRLAGEMYYEDGYAGYNRLEALSSKIFVSKAGAWLGSDEYTKIFESLFDETRINYDLVDNNSSLLNYRYILVEKDAVYYPKLDLSSSLKPSVEIEQNLNKKIWDKIFDNKKSSLYKIKDDVFEGKISISDCSVSFSSVNHVKYRLYISGLKKAEELSFMEAFHSGWKIYLKPISKKDWCEYPEYFTKLNVTECENNQKLFETSDLLYLWEESVFDNTHSIYNLYANSWKIDPEYVKQKFPKEYYNENSDGSIDVELALYFKPQSYFNLGLIISSTTLLCCFSYFGYDLIKRYRWKAMKRLENRLNLKCKN